MLLVSEQLLFRVITGKEQVPCGCSIGGVFLASPSPSPSPPPESLTPASPPTRSSSSSHRSPPSPPRSPSSPPLSPSYTPRSPSPPLRPPPTPPPMPPDQSADGSFPCPRCPRTYRYRSYLLRHLSLKCGRKEQEHHVWGCALCDYRTQRKGNLHRHLLHCHPRDADDSE